MRALFIDEEPKMSYKFNG